MYNDHVITSTEHQSWFRENSSDESSCHLVFEYKDRPAGLTYLTDLDRRNGTCRWGFYLGERDLPRGSGTVMGYLSVEYAFRELNLRRVTGEVLSFNQASQKFFRRLGFTEEGRLRRHLVRGSEFIDVVLFGMLSDEWTDHHSVQVRDLISATEVTA